MKNQVFSTLRTIFVASTLTIAFPQLCVAQGASQDRRTFATDTTFSSTEEVATQDSLKQEDSRQLPIVQETNKKRKRDWETWRPNTKKALWLAIVLPGAGQIYNRKYWKLPIVYGGFMGCIYAMQWNNSMYHDYSKAYMDIMDNDPNTQSYNQFLHLGNKITSDNIERYKTIFKNRKDRFRRWRDMSFFAMIGVYALSIIDAYVDASLSEFDISKDLSLRISPTMLKQESSQNSIQHSTLGLQCSLTF